MDQISITPQTGPATGDTAYPDTPVFLADRAAGNISTSQSPALRHIAELVAHRSAQTPMTVGLFGASGTGKSHAARRMAARVTALAAAADASSPFVQRILTVSADAPDLVSEPATGIVRAIHGALAASGPAGANAALAREAAHAAADPQAAARDANERLDEARRRARLSETVLYDSAASRIDAYARKNRAQIDARLRGFGFTGETIASYKDLVRDLADHPGAGTRIAAFVRSLWAFQGQTTFIVWAIILFLLAWGLGIADQTRHSWLASLRAANENLAGATTWIEANAGWFQTLRHTAILAALLCLATNIWRAVQFVIPLIRGATLLEADVVTRRDDLDDQITHQSRRIDMLAAEVEARTRRAQEAERRARDSEKTGVSPETELPFDIGETSQARLAMTYLDAVQRGMRGIDGPQRIVLFVDGFNAVKPAEAATLFDQLHRLLDRPGFATIVVADPQQVAAGWGTATESAARFERYVQTPFSLRDLEGDDVAAYARTLLGDAQPRVETPVDASRSVLDTPLGAEERALLAALTALAGDTPRAVKRFINTYRLARPRADDTAALALMIALDNGGTSGELAAMGAAMDLHMPATQLIVHPGERRLATALDAVNANRSVPLTIAQAHGAWSIARDYRTPMP